MTTIFGEAGGKFRVRQRRIDVWSFRVGEDDEDDDKATTATERKGGRRPGAVLGDVRRAYLLDPRRSQYRRFWWLADQMQGGCAEFFGVCAEGAPKV